MTLLGGSDLSESYIGSTEFKFNQLTQQQYAIVNDGVMGGRSNSELKVSQQKVRYQGDVSLENNGGFASVRMLWPFKINVTDDELTMAILKVKGDGLTYQFRLRTNRGFDGAAYSFSFNTQADQQQTVHIPIDQFIPTFRGRTLRDMPELKFSDVQQMGILVADSQEGQFELDLYTLELK